VSYRADVEALGEFLSGHERPIMERLEREMEAFLGAEAVLEHVCGRGKSLVDVAAPHPDRRRADEAGPALAGRQHVILHDVLGFRHDGCCDVARTRRLGDPFAVARDVVEDRRAQAHGAQHVG